MTGSRRSATSRVWSFAVNGIASSPLVRVEQRSAIWRRAGIELGDGVDLRPHGWLFSSQLRIGSDTLLGPHFHIENREPVVIGARCAVAQQVSIVTSSHEVGDRSRRAGAYSGRPVTIADGCWIGARSTILGGVSIGAGTIVAAGSVVTSDCLADHLYAGVPATPRRRLD